jgi:hypothetical protein
MTFGKNLQVNRNNFIDFPFQTRYASGMMERARLPIFEPVINRVDRVQIQGMTIREYHVAVNGIDRTLYSARNRVLSPKECERLADSYDKAKKRLQNEKVRAFIAAHDTTPEDFIYDSVSQFVTNDIWTRAKPEFPKQDYRLGPLIRQEAYRQLFVRQKAILAQE